MELLFTPPPLDIMVTLHIILIGGVISECLRKYLNDDFSFGVQRSVYAFDGVFTATYKDNTWTICMIYTLMPDGSICHMDGLIEPNEKWRPVRPREWGTHDNKIIPHFYI